jgi:hypothetical protein
MTEKEQTSKSSQKRPMENENASSDGLSEEQLDKATGGTTIGSATGGAGAGKVSVSDFSF